MSLSKLYREIRYGQDPFTENSGSNAQNVNFTDLICEGPIRGLVGGAGGVFFDDVAVEDAALSEFSPTPGTGTGSNSSTSGQITFTGSGASSVGTVNADVDLSGLELISGSSRSITLLYATTTATLTSVNTITDSEGTEISTQLTFQATSGTPFNTGWNATNTVNQLNNKARAIVSFTHPELDLPVTGPFEITDGDTAVFSTFVGDTIFPQTGTYTLKLYYTLNVENIDINNNQVTVTGTPAAGVYSFIINRQVQYSDPGGDVSPNNINAVGRINGFHVDFRNGSLEQPVVTSTGGVGGAVQVTGTKSGINLTDLKMINQSTANSLGFTIYDVDGLPNVDGGKSYPGNPDTTVLANAATVIPSASFGLDTAAKVVEADEIGFTIRYSALQVINQNSGDREPAYAKYVMEMRVKQNGTFTDFHPLFFGGQVTHSGDTNAPISFDHIISLQGYRNLLGPFEDFEVRISRVTRHIGMPVRWDGTSQGVTNKQKWNLQAKAQIESLRAVIKDNLRYPYSAIASVSFSSRDRASTPKRSYLLEGKMVKVPTTYIPREYSYSGIAKYDQFWDGTFRQELLYTDNPAWVFYDLITNNRYGAGRWIKESDVDKFALYRIARYCDELVDDGKEYDATSTLKKGELYKIHSGAGTNTGEFDFTTIGADNNTVGTIFRATGTSITDSGVAYGVEPRFRANVLLTKATDVYKVLKDFATIFLGILYWQDSKLTPVNEAPQDPIYNFTKGNVINGEFNYESSGSRTRTNQIIVTWNDPASNYEPVPLLVEDRESIIRTGRIISQPAVAFGATSEGQAIRYGRWKLWTAQNQTEIINFKTSLAAHYIKPGDIINVQDADRYGISYSGRTSSATSTTLTFDRSVAFNSGSTYELSTVVTDSAAVNSSRNSISIQDDQDPANTYTYASGSKVAAAWVYSNNSYTYTTLDTEEKASNAFIDSSGSQLLSLAWKPYSYVETHEITNPGSAATTVTLANSATFSTTPSANNIWALKEVSGSLNTNASKKMYKVLSVAEEETNQFAVSAVEHYNEKYTAIEDEYELGYVAETIYNDTPPPTMSEPKNPRIRLATDATRPGEEFLFEWDDPAENADEVLKYQVVHNIKNKENPLTTGSNSILFEEVVNGSVLLKVRAISKSGVPSRFVALNYIVNDPYETNIERVQYGIPKGAITNSEAGLTGSSGSEAFTFARTNVIIASNGEKEELLTPDENSQDISDIAADENYYVFLDADTPTLSLMYYDTESLENMPFWRDVGTGNSASSTSWTSIGSILIGENDNTVFGTGFNTNVQLRDILNLSGSTTASSPPGEGAVVISIVSDTQLIIDRTFDTQISTTGYRANYRPDYAQDAVIARVHKDSSNVFTTERFLTVDPDLGGTTKSVILDVDVATLNYSSSGASQVNAPSSINATISSVGFQEPEFKIVIPTGFDNAGTQDFAVSTESDPLQKSFVLDSDGAVAYNSGVSLTIEASVREKNSPDTVKTTQFVVTKNADGPPGDTGAQGPDGDTGLRGDTGPQGNTGAQGPDGDTGPRGDTGPQGNTGLQGPDGDTGLRGDTGPQGNTGVQGPDGDTGPRGNTGVQGPDGDTGPVGDTGPRGNTGVQGPDGDTGAQGPVGDTGLRGNTGVQGPDGDTGPRGNTGVQGPEGDTGAQGPDGDTGAQGPVGDTGLRGNTGVQGPVGDTGPQGNTGVQGPDGDTGAQGPDGDTGAQGPVGDTGLRGNTGVQGPDGDTGAQGPVGDTGPRGNTGAQGPDGDTGPVGNTGVQGPDGDTGVRGPTGNTGVQGPVGDTGPRGNTGVQGPDGDTGPVGGTGVVGPSGQQGPAGSTGVAGNQVFTYYSTAPDDTLDSSPTINTWASGGSYSLGNVRAHSSKVYVALQNHSNRSVVPASDTNFWAEIFAGADNSSSTSDFTRLTPTVFISTGGYWLTVEGGQTDSQYRWYVDATVAGVTNIKWTIAALEKASIDITQDDFQDPVLVKGQRGEQGAQGASGATGPRGNTGVQGPAGDTGPRGNTGVQGPDGDTGPVGDTGPRGNTGVQGPDGDTGVRGPTGNTGVQGPDGDTGVQGPDGDTGAQGPVGDTGLRGNTGVQGPDGDTGAQGPVGDTGPRGNTGVQGPDGDTGPVGNTGVQGPDGDTGVRGPTGNTGVQGPDGDTGPRGNTGVQGPAGDTGPRGNTGVQGPDGDTGVQGPDGDTGAQGPVGDTGPRGNTGVQGPDGDTGAQGPVGDTGLRGNTGVQGPDGDTGPQGNTGLRGNTGVQGPDGDTGPVGDTGLRGDTGPQGNTGVQGPEGDTGPRGNTGAQGPDGATGPSGDTGLRGNTGVTGVTGPSGPAGSAGNAIVFDTDGLETDANKYELIQSFRGTNDVLRNDVYWDVQGGRVFQWQNDDTTSATIPSGQTFEELTTSSYGGFLSADALTVSSETDGSKLAISSTKIEIFDGTTLRVKIGKLT